MSFKILLIGPSGYIGSVLTKSLKKKFQLSCIVRRKSKIDISSYKDLYFHDELKNDEEFIKILSKYDVLINCYGYAHSSVNSKKDFFNLLESNISFCKRIFRLASLSKLNKVIHLSSIKAMGEEGTFDVNTVPRPISYYGRSKLISERILINYFKKLKIKKMYNIIRLPLVLGKNKFRGYLKIIHYYLKLNLPFPIFKDTNYRSYILEKDLVKLIINIIEDKNIISRTILYQSFKLDFEGFIKKFSYINNKQPYFIYIPNFIKNIILKILFKKIHSKIFSKNIIINNYKLN